MSSITSEPSNTQQTLSGLNKKDYQKTVDGKQTDLYVLKNAAGAEVCITNYGGKIVSIMVPDKNGKLSDVVCGHKNIDDYLSSKEPYFGAIIGRYGNRIAGGKFSIDDVEYTLEQNNGPNSLHGGPKGFHAQVWDAKKLSDKVLELTYVSPDGEEGFPGELTTIVTYTLTDDNAVDIAYKATTTKPTVVNLTNHSYFNLSGKDTSSVESEIVTINADSFIPVNENLIPLGKPETVTGTPMDFKTPHIIGERINNDFTQLKIARGYDHTWVLNKSNPDELSFAAKLEDADTGRVMDVFTTEPGMQMYTGNFMDSNAWGKQGNAYPFRSGVCFEVQHFPDSPNQPNFPSVILRPGETYKSRCIYKFSVK